MSITWADVAAESDLFDGAAIAATPAGQDIALYSLAGEGRGRTGLLEFGGVTHTAFVVNSDI